jgi:hypothetical protein
VCKSDNYDGCSHSVGYPLWNVFVCSHFVLLDA